MQSLLRSVVSLSLAVVILDSLVFAHTPVDFLEVLKVDPARSIEHGVQLKSKFDTAKVETKLEGPQLFSQAIGCMERPVKKNLAYLNWFKIVQPKDEPIREVTVLDMVRGSENKLLQIQNSEYMLSPSQRITSGAPAPIPEGLDHYKAYRIVDAPEINREIELTASIGPETRRLGKALFLCVAVSEWHHDEHFPATHPNDCFVVYELDPHDVAKNVSTIDQFGLNALQITQSQWLCVRAALLRSSVK